MAGVFDTIDKGKGDVKSIVLGLSTGLTLLAVRYSAKGFWPWLGANYGGASILINTSVIVAGMWAGTVLFRTSLEQ